jgi:hypothetical protein
LKISYYIFLGDATKAFDLIQRRKLTQTLQQHLSTDDALLHEQLIRNKTVEYTMVIEGEHVTIQPIEA